jgi:uncharacterized protein (DUF924 family)
MSRMLKGDFNDHLDRDAVAVLEFWLGDTADPENAGRRREFWFAASERRDQAMRERFGELHERAQRGELDHWAAGPRGTLALILLLDQFTRNLYRGTPSAFASDARALAISREGMARGMDGALGVVERVFWYMPFQHCEDNAVQRESVRLYKAVLDDSPAPFIPFSKNAYEYAVLHCEIIERFGRFPHRNDLLGRPSTREEKEYLEGGGHRFGQG